jgi:hypothetical protein
MRRNDTMKHDQQRRYEEDLLEFHRDKGWFYVTPEESRRAFDTLLAAIATEKAQRQAVSDLFQSSGRRHTQSQVDVEEWIKDLKDGKTLTFHGTIEGNS